MARKPKPSGRRPGIGQPRQGDELGRRAKDRRTYPTILILCEGKETEPNSFEALRLDRERPGIRIKVVSGGESVTAL